MGALEAILGIEGPWVGRDKGSGRRAVRSGRGSAHVAQSVEHVLGKDEVTGSIPVVSSTS
jgi:hypothetical protein